MPVSTPNGYLDFTNATPRATKVIATSNVGVGTSNPEFNLDVHGTANVGTLTATTATVSGDVYAPNLPLATIGSNLVTWNDSTGVFQDSGGLFSNKLAVVSEQPPSALAGASTTITNHGVYKVTASTGSPENAFDKSAGTSWTASSDYGGGGGTGVYVPGTARLHTSTVQGDWIALEFPYKTTLRHLTFTGNTEKANLYATNDGGITWTELKNWESGETTVVVDASENYKKYGLVTTKTTGNATLSLTELRFFTESFAIDGGKVAMASGAITGGNTIMDQTGPHARHVVPLRKYPEVNMQDYIYAGYRASASADQNVDRAAAGYNPIVSRSAWAAFNGSETSGFWQLFFTDFPYDTTEPYDANTNAPIITDVDNVDHRGHWIKLELPHKIKVQKMTTNHGDQPERYDSVILLGSNDDTNWYVIKDTFTLPVTSFTSTEINSDTAYKYVLLLIKSLGTTDNQVDLYQLEYYGYEETSDPDTSVDTTITSQFNLPDTTGVKLYIDGDKGSTATDFSGEGHTLTDNSASFSGNAWSFTSLSTSNVTMTSGDLAMEGTHPHSVSLWFNAANVSSNATLFHVGTAVGEGDAKTSISLTETGHLGWIDGGDNQFLSANTWHNLVYATQGGGGVRTCYLDGRKLGDAQVQDTFGDYPPFAMTTYSQYGYTVSASSDLDTTYHAWEAFDDDENDGWICDDYNSDGTTPRYTGGITSSGGGVYQGPISTGSIPISGSGSETIAGEYIQIEFPFKFKLEDIAYQREGAYWGYNRLPHSGSIVACNDGINWKTIHNWTGLTDADVGSTDGSNLAITQAPFRSGIFAVDKSGATYDAYKFFRIICTRIQKTDTSGDGNSYGLWSVWQLELYGHKENDTTRFPVSSTVLKYPHVAMTGPAQRGYVASASSEHSSSTFGGYNGIQEGKLFDDDPATFWHAETNGTDDHRYDGTADAAGGRPYGADSISNFDPTGINIPGEWVQLEFPHKLKISKVHIRARPANEHQSPKDFSFYGSNTGSAGSWTLIQSFTGEAPQDNGTSYYAITSNPAHYKYILMLITRVVGTSALSMAALQYYGTEEDLDVVARVGEGLDGKVANFRVYDKYLREEQALELWDAQKDQFGRAESSVVVHKGRLGVGTTEPSAALTVMDEAEEMEEFPPRAMTAAETYMEGYGVFRATADSHGAGNTSIRHPWKAFIKGTTGSTSNGDNSWLDNSGDFNNTTGVYDGSLTHHIGSVSGEYLQLELPYEIQLSSYSLAPWNYPNGGAFQYADFPRDFIIYGSKDSVSWDIVDTRSGQSSTYQGDVPNYHVNSQKTYKYFVIVVTKINTTTYANGAVYVAIGEWRLFGTRERGQSTLHDGQLTLTKNLTVPRIGPALDADDTPHRDRLVVEYNTSTNPTANGTVKDTSGSGNDGLFYGDARYDATEKALVFDGTDDYAIATLNNPAGDYIHSVSWWFKNDDTTSAIGTNEQVMWFIGPQWSAGKCSYASFYDNKLYFAWNTYNINCATTNIKESQWNHVCFTYTGGGSSLTTRKIYINGVVQTSSLDNTEGQLLNLPGSTYLTLGNMTGQTKYFDGSISNFKLYDTALTADEVKRLYDMGRCDEGHHVVNFSKTRVGIGLGDGEAPRADLDVRGNILYTGTSRPHALPTMWDHMDMGRNGPGVYPIIGTQGGSKVYNVYCEPDIFGGGWMCFTQIPQTGGGFNHNIVNLYTFDSGDSGNLKRTKFFNVPYNILSDTDGVNCDILVLAYGDSLRYNMQGAKLGAIWRGVDLNTAFDATVGDTSSVTTTANAAQATSPDGFTFTSLSGDLLKSGGWEFSISTENGTTGAYNNYDDGTGGFIIHGHTGQSYSLYGKVKGPASDSNYSSNTGFEIIRIFVRLTQF
jgi:hypothetical protein